MTGQVGGGHLVICIESKTVAYFSSILDCISKEFVGLRIWAHKNKECSTKRLTLLISSSGYGVGRNGKLKEKKVAQINTNLMIGIVYLIP